MYTQHICLYGHRLHFIIVCGDALMIYDIL